VEQFMKKFFALVLLLCMALSLISGCTVKDPYDQYLAAMEKTEAIEQMQASISYTLSMNYNNFTLDITAFSEAKTTVVGGKSVNFQNVNMSFLGFTFESEWYDYEDFRYTSKNGVKTKETIPEYDSGMSPLDFKKDDIISSTFEKVDKGSKYTVTLSGSIAEESLANIFPFDDFLEIFGLNTNDGIMSSDVTMYFIIDKDGYISEFLLQYESTVTIDGAPFTFSMDISMSFVFGDVTIELPDFSEYV